MDEEQRKAETDLWMKKISTMEYHALNTCEQVVGSYRNRVDALEVRLSAWALYGPSPFCTADVKGLHSAIITLQYLLGQSGRMRSFVPPRTLETALRNAGIEDQAAIDQEVGRAEEYLQTAESLTQKADALHGQWLDLTYGALTMKMRQGEVLTASERETYDHILDIKSVDH